ncbi:MAG: hypothetical protein KH054_02585 [Firmicutes bacterium]|nr:hypothetical protein [Bacillota bacterium]
MQLTYVAIPDKLHAEGVGFLAAATTTASKIPLYTPKISFDSRPTNPALLPLLFKGQSFVLPLYLSARNDFGQRNFSVDEKSSSRKNCPYCKGFSLRGFFCEAKQAYP